MGARRRSDGFFLSPHPLHTLLWAPSALSGALAEAAQAKYEFVFRQQILDYYRGRPLTLGEGTR